MRYFLVNMVDGKVFACCPDADDPTKFEWQVMETVDTGMERQDRLMWVARLREGEVARLRDDE